MYRLFIDIPLSAATTEEAVRIGQHIMDAMILSENNKMSFRVVGVEQLNYRLGHDEDRQKSNYFILDDKGHCSNKKCKVNLKEE
jgi:hypothetical protein